MGTDHYLLERVKKKEEGEALHQTNIHSRWMKLDINRHIQ
jgi:hypothetical protein